ncbi:hypothetical protein Tco_0090430 [Tanacetum coccineum]
MVFLEFFIRKYWNIIQHDVVNAVKEFFSSSKFPPGSNSSFITLIPKSLDAKMVKDFRPISIIWVIQRVLSSAMGSDSGLMKVPSAEFKFDKDDHLLLAVVLLLDGFLEGPLKITIMAWKVGDMKNRNKHSLLISTEYGYAL